MSTRLVVVPRLARRPRHVLVRLLALSLAATATACLDDAPLAPTPGSVRLAISAQISPGPGERTVAIGVYYMRRDETRVDLPVTPATVNVPRGGTATRAITVQITDCLADPDRFSESATMCHLFVELRLLDEDGEYISEQTQQVEASPTAGEVELEPFDLPQLAIGVSATSAHFEAQEDDESLPPATLIHVSSVTGAPLGELDVDVSYGGEEAPSWLLASIDENGTLTLRPTRTDLFPDTYDATVEITASREGVESVTVDVSYEVKPVTGGGELVMFGDINLFDATALLDANNGILMRNLVSYRTEGPRGSLRGVQIECGIGSLFVSTCQGFWDVFDDVLASDDYFSFTTTTLEGPLSISPDAKVLMLVLSCRPFAASELNAIKAFAAQGGRVIYVSEHSGVFNIECGAVQDQLAASLGVGMSHVSAGLDCGYQLVPGASLRHHQITRGMTGLTVACSSALKLGAGAQALYYDISGTQVLAAVGMIDPTPIRLPAVVLNWSPPTAPVAIAGRSAQTAFIGH